MTEMTALDRRARLVRSMTVAGIVLGLGLNAMLWSGEALRAYAPAATHARVSVGPVFAVWFRLVVGLRRGDRPWRSLGWLAASGWVAVAQTALLTAMVVAGWALSKLALPLFFWGFAAMVALALWSIQAYAGWGTLDAPRDAWPADDQVEPWRGADYAMVALGVVLDGATLVAVLR